jgi:hypothetical protein
MMASWIWELHFLGLWHGLAGEVLQLDAAQRSSAQLSASSSSSTASPLLSAQPFPLGSAWTAAVHRPPANGNGSLGLPGITIFGLGPPISSSSLSPQP